MEFIQIKKIEFKYLPTHKTLQINYLHTNLLSLQIYHTDPRVMLQA